ncbi:MAG: hypothetical protein AABZ67_01710 [Pseudomonadota bacterium]
MLTAMIHAFRFFRHVLKRMVCVIVLSMFGTAAVAASSCDSRYATPPGHTDQIASPAGHGYNVVNGCSPELCRKMLATCATAPDMTVAVPPTQNSPLPDTTTAPQHLLVGWLSAQHVPVVAVPLPLSFPLYLQTSRLLI